MQLKILLYSILMMLAISCAEGKYKKEPLPDSFTYSVAEDNSNPVLDKNELVINISEKLSVEQLATLADEVFKSKPRQKRFYIFYELPNTPGTWATSHFDPDLEISILGFTQEQDEHNKEDLVDMTIIGKWSTEKFGFTVIYFKDANQIEKIKTIYSAGGESIEDVKSSLIDEETRIDYDNNHGEYFIIQRDGKLGLYSENGKYGEAEILTK